MCGIHSLTVRTLASHASDRGSIPRGSICTFFSFFLFSLFAFLPFCPFPHFPLRSTPLPPPPALSSGCRRAIGGATTTVLSCDSHVPKLAPRLVSSRPASSRFVPPPPRFPSHLMAVRRVALCRVASRKSPRFCPPGTEHRALGTGCRASRTVRRASRLAHRAVETGQCSGAGCGVRSAGCGLQGA